MKNTLVVLFAVIAMVALVLSLAVLPGSQRDQSSLPEPFPLETLGLPPSQLILGLDVRLARFPGIESTELTSKPGDPYTWRSGKTRSDGRREGNYLFLQSRPGQVYIRAQVQVTGGSPRCNAYVVWDTSFDELSSESPSVDELKRFLSGQENLTLPNARVRCYFTDGFSSWSNKAATMTFAAATQPSGGDG